MTDGISRQFGGQQPPRPKVSWEDRRLVWAVREPFRTQTTGVQLCAGQLEPGEQLQRLLQQIRRTRTRQVRLPGPGHCVVELRQILGGAKELLLPQSIILQIQRAADFPMASAMSVLLMLTVTVAYFAMARWLRLDRM